MNARSYSDYTTLHDCAATIASEVIRQGESDGWSGRFEELDAVKEILAPRGIVYFDDMRGSWKAREV